MKRIQPAAMIVLMVIMIVSMSACGSEGDQESPAPDNETEVTESNSNESADKEAEIEDLKVEPNDELLQKYSKDDEEGFFDADFSSKTDIAFSAGDSDNWNYSHNKREFPVDKCYARISSTAITKHFWGKNDKFDVYYIFTGTKKCDVESSKGNVESIESDDPNVTIYKKTLEAAKAKKAETISSEFTITPKEACGLRVDVIYDSSVPSKYDDSRTIQFSKNAKKDE